jgi:hypothetical protein
MFPFALPTLLDGSGNTLEISNLFSKLSKKSKPSISTNHKDGKSNTYNNLMNYFHYPQIHPLWLIIQVKNLKNQKPN